MASMDRMREIARSEARARKVLKDADWALLKALTEVAYNVQRGNVRLTKTQQRTVNKWRQVINTLADTDVELEKKRELLAKKTSARAVRSLIRSVPWLREWR